MGQAKKKRKKEKKEEMRRMRLQRKEENAKEENEKERCGQRKKKINPVNSRDKIGISVKKKGQFWKSKEIRRKDPIALGPNC